MSQSAVSWSETLPSREDDEPDTPSTKVTILSLVFSKGHLGAAIVHSDKPNVLFLLETQPELPGYPTAEDRIILSSPQPANYRCPVVTRENPDIVIVPGRGETSVVGSIQSTVGKMGEKKVEIVMGLASEFRPHYFTALFPLSADLIANNQQSISAASSIIATMKKSQLSVMLPSTVEWFSLSSYMSIDYDSLLALQIVSQDVHPNMHFTNARCGLSLASLMNRCKSAPGKHLFKYWILRPLKLRRTIEERQEAVGWMIDNIVSRGYLAEVRKLLQGVNRIELILGNLSGQNSHQGFKDLLKFVKSFREIRQILMCQHCRLPCVADVDVDLLSATASSITGIIDFVQSEAQGRMVVRSRVNPDLDRVRRQYHSLPDLLSSMVQEVAARITEPKIRVLNIVYFPQLGFLVTIPVSEELRAEDVKEAGFALQFTTEKAGYFKDDVTLRLDAEIGDIYADILDMEVEIVRVLVDQVLLNKSTFAVYSQKLAEIDCLLSLAEFAVENGLVKPLISESEEIDIVDGRHLLQEKVSDHIVGNDFALGVERIAVITGPNSSGKSIFMKQIGLIVYLAQVGSFVPARAATIGIVDRIFTRIQTRESVSSESSAFQTDLAQVKRALACSGPKSLFLMDEFGKGTSPEEGIAIFASVIASLARQTDCPRTIAITHFHEVYQLGLLGPELPIRWCTMDTIEDDTRITFLYKVVAGKASSSLGIRCGRMAGVPEDVLRRAEELTDLFAARIPPLSIRYAKVDARLEHLAVELVTAVQRNEALPVLKDMAEQLLHHRATTTATATAPSHSPP